MNWRSLILVATLAAGCQAAPNPAPQSEPERIGHVIPRGNTPIGDRVIYAPPAANPAESRTGPWLWGINGPTQLPTGTGAPTATTGP